MKLLKAIKSLYMYMLLNALWKKPWGILVIFKLSTEVPDSL